MARSSATVLAVAVAATVLAAAVPAARQPSMLAASWAAVVLVLLAVARRRPVPAWPWLALAAMLAVWPIATVLAVDPQRLGPHATAALAAAQGCAAAVGVAMAFPRVARGHRCTSPVDLAIIVLSAALVATQLCLVVSDRGALTTSAVLAPSIDVTFVALILLYAVTRRRLDASAALTLSGALVYVGADLVGALDGFRVLPDGHPAQVAAVAAALLLAAGALHPSMVRGFDRAELALRRPASAALLGLVPLTAVPAGLWAVAEATGVRGLPTVALLGVGVAISALCLVRAALALRSAEVLAEHDPLTGLLNQHGLQVAHRLRGQARWAMLLVDVDDFKAVNDTHGHDVGDLALLAVRDRLQVAAATCDALLARLGGDEFALMTPPGSAHDLAQEVLTVLREPVPVGPLLLRTRASVGVALPDDVEPAAGPGSAAAAPTTTGAPAAAAPPDAGPAAALEDRELSELLTHADVAMYAAKAAGRDTAVLYRPQMRVDVAHRFTLGNELRVLLGRPDAGAGRLEVHYQVLVELGAHEGDERVTGAEALVRWRHPRLGLLAPGDFLGLVATAGLDAALDEAVLREVVDQVARWRSRGRTVAPISVNLTRSSLLREDLVELVLTLLVDARVPARLLHLEITEHEELPEDDDVAARLLALDEAGVRLHLDDYGTGYTSMDYLCRFPVRVLKIDRSVTATLDALVGGAGGAHPDACSVPARSSVVAGLAAMTGALGLEMLAEGVETHDQAAMLRSLGVRYAQGYLYGRPQSAAEHAVSQRSAVGPAAARGDDVAPAGGLTPVL